MANRGVLVIYTGGTIGAVPTDPTDAQSPLAAASWDVLSADLPELDQLDFDIVARSTRRPIDSSNIVTDDWLEIAELIVSAYDDFEGFVVLHGTDTMAYSASALSFMLANLAKPVVFTGAQIPVVDRPESDGRSNLMAALAIANPDASEIACVPEVCIFFHDRLLRGNRATKIDSAGLLAFDSPNLEPLGRGGQPAASGARGAPGSPLRLHREIEPNVVPFQVFPGVQHTRFFRETFEDPDIAGIVLQTYGVGNAPNDRAFIDVIRPASEQKIIVNITQCQAGAIAPGRYATSAGIADYVANGADMTLEASLTKLMVLLGDRTKSRADVFALMETNLAGERD